MSSKFSYDDFVVITQNSSVPLCLSLFYYSPDGTITKMDTQSL